MYYYILFGFCTLLQVYAQTENIVITETGHKIPFIHIEPTSSGYYVYDSNGLRYAVSNKATITVIRDAPPQAVTRFYNAPEPEPAPKPIKRPTNQKLVISPPYAPIAPPQRSPTYSRGSG